MGATDFDDDDHTTLCVSLITSHGRAAPLVWRTVKKSKLKNRRTGYELEMVERVLDRVPRGTHVTWLGDRAFAQEIGAPWFGHAPLVTRTSGRCTGQHGALAPPATLTSLTNAMLPAARSVHPESFAD
jgi:hypothetical protein